MDDYKGFEGFGFNDKPNEWNIVEKMRISSMRANPKSISIGKSLLRFGEEISKYFIDKQFTHIKILVNYTENKIAFAGTNNSMIGFKYRLDETGNYKKIICNSSRFTDRIPLDSYEAELIGDMWVIKVNKISGKI